LKPCIFATITVMVALYASRLNFSRSETEFLSWICPGTAGEGLVPGPHRESPGGDPLASCHRRCTKSRGRASGSASSWHHSWGTLLLARAPITPRLRLFTTPPPLPPLLASPTYKPTPNLGRGEISSGTPPPGPVLCDLCHSNVFLSPSEILSYEYPDL
jgi:hypothetical protein